MACAARNRASAVAPSTTQDACMPQAVSCASKMARLVAWSSTHKTCTPRNSGSVAPVASAGAGRGASRTVNQKVLPWPGVLSTPIAPPIRVTSGCEMVRPNPVPPYFRVVEPSAWENAWNRRAWTSGGMPMPVSVTANRSRAVSSCASTSPARTTTSPRSVNFRALPTRLVRIWRSRPGSPATQGGTSGWRQYASSSSLVAARDEAGVIGPTDHHQQAQRRTDVVCQVLVSRFQLPADGDIAAGQRATLVGHQFPRQAQDVTVAGGDRQYMWWFGAHQVAYQIAVVAVIKDRLV